MANFFDKNNLTVEQQKRWDDAVIEYKKISEINTIEQFNLLSKEEQNEILSYSDNKELLNKMFNYVIDQNSALFGRLLNNKKGLIYPPPCAYSYPWYDVIEQEGPWELELELDFSIHNNIWDNILGRKCVMLNQTPWKIVKKVNDTEYLITYGKWENLNYLWKLKLEIKSCEETTMFIACHHKDKDRITNIEELKDEIKFHFVSRFNNLKLLSDKEYYENYKKELEDKYQNIGNGILLTQIESAKNFKEEREKENLPLTYSEKEIQEHIEQTLNNYINRGFIIGEDGKMYNKVWNLYKVSGKVDESIYLNF